MPRRKKDAEETPEFAPPAVSPATSVQSGAPRVDSTVEERAANSKRGTRRRKPAAGDERAAEEAARKETAFTDGGTTVPPEDGRAEEQRGADSVQRAAKEPLSAVAEEKSAKGRSKRQPASTSRKASARGRKAKQSPNETEGTAPPPNATPELVPTSTELPLFLSVPDEVPRELLWSATTGKPFSKPGITLLGRIASKPLTWFVEKAAPLPTEAEVDAPSSERFEATDRDSAGVAEECEQGELVFGEPEQEGPEEVLETGTATVGLSREEEKLETPEFADDVEVLEEEEEREGEAEEGEIYGTPLLVDEALRFSSPEEQERWRRICEAASRLGIQRLYPEQERAILAAMDGQDVLVVLPTGFGKSAIYQIPSMVLPKPVVLVSPLLALLKDQQEKLLSRNIPVERIDGTVRGKARQDALDRIAQGGSLLVMTTPETLGSEELGQALRASGISLAAVDEAHCISEWGHDFRPAYMRIGERLRELGSPPVLALTATATQAVRDDIIRYLGMRDPTIVASSPHRANLAFEVVHATGNERLRALTRFIKRLRRPGIVYCSTTKAVDHLYGALRLLRMPVHRYHGKMAAKDRNREQELFMKRGRRTIMVATSAFGLGIDKPDIRYIIHFQAPASLEQYVQEAGRAGRDGRKAHCILLFDPKDRETHEVLQQGSRIRPDQLYRISKALKAYAEEGREANMEGLCLASQLNERQAKALLVVLEEAELVKLEEDRVRVTVPAEEFEEQARALATRFVTLRTQDARRLDYIAEYASSRECRAVFLRRYFGEEDGTPCGLCDNCRGARERPATFYQPIARPQPTRKRRRKRKKRKGSRGKAQVIIVRQQGSQQGAPTNGEAVPQEPLPDLAAEPEPLPLPSDEGESQEFS